MLLFWRRLPLLVMLTSQGWLTRLHSPKEGDPCGIALATAGLLVYPDTTFMAALGD
jgi:prepilin peptidase CpaA